MQCGWELTSIGPSGSIGIQLTELLLCDLVWLKDTLILITLAKHKATVATYPSGSHKPRTCFILK